MGHPDYLQFVFAFAFVIGLIWAVAVGAKKLGLDQRVRGVSGGRKGRLHLLETLYLDPKRKVTLIRADDKEYLVLLAGDGGAQIIDSMEVKADAAA